MSSHIAPPDRLPPVTWQVTQADIDAYGALCDANDPIHVDPAFARSTPFGGTIAQGLLIFGRLSTLFAAGPWDPVTWARDVKIEVVFKGPARPGDNLTLEAIRYVGPASLQQAEPLIYDIVCRRADGVVLISGRAQFPAG